MLLLGSPMNYHASSQVYLHFISCDVLQSNGNLSIFEQRIAILIPKLGNVTNNDKISSQITVLNRQNKCHVFNSEQTCDDTRQLVLGGILRKISIKYVYIHFKIYHKLTGTFVLPVLEDDDFVLLMSGT